MPLAGLKIFLILLLCFLSSNAFAFSEISGDGGKEVRVVFIGDSITAGYGVLKTEAFPERLEQLLSLKLTKKKLHLVFTNAGVAGSLSSSATSRLRFYLKFKPQILVLELGGNDVLKGTAISVIRKNLIEAIDLAQKNQMHILLLGMKIYSNFGEIYAKAFANMYLDLAREKKIDLMPFLLEGVALDPNLMQSDQKHPNAKGHQVIAENLVKFLEPLLLKEIRK